MAVLPWGATEAHNRHLPYATDTVQVEAVSIEGARQAWAAGARVVVLPALPFGVQTGQLDVPLCLNVNPSTQAMVLGDLARSLTAHGVRKLVIVNGHGGNDFRAMIRELQPATPLFLSVVNWYACVPPASYFTAPGDHAGELETSVMLHLAPALVRPLSEAGAGHERQFRVRGLRERWAWAPRRWSSISDDTGVGDPSAATAERGARYFAAVAERLAEYFTELAAADPAHLYEEPPDA